MTDWTPRMLDLAELVAGWSKDPSTQVGAVIADPMNRIVSQGFNGLPRGVADGPLDRDEKHRRTIHAEVNAVLFAQRPLADCTLYVTHHPCARCAAVIIQAGIRRVVIGGGTLRDDWAADMASAQAMFNEAGVTYGC